jgi:hypothetical protein
MCATHIHFILGDYSKGIYFVDMSNYDGAEDYEAHIHLTVPELCAL